MLRGAKLESAHYDRVCAVLGAVGEGPLRGYAWVLPREVEPEGRGPPRRGGGGRGSDSDAGAGVAGRVRGGGGGAGRGGGGRRGLAAAGARAAEAAEARRADDGGSRIESLDKSDANLHEETLHDT